MIAEINTDNKFMACQGVPICKIAVLNSGEDLSQLINKLQPLIATREKEHPSQRVYTTFTDRRYRNQDQALSHQQLPHQPPQEIEHQLRAIKKFSSRGNPNNGQSQATP